MKYTLIPSSEANDDIREIARYLSDQREELGFRFYDRVDETYRRIAESPEMKAKVAFRFPQMQNARICPIKGFSNYLIFYRIESDRIEILRVLHGATDYASLFDVDTSTDAD